MARCATKAVGNVYYEARIKAAKWNDKLKSREGAENILNLGAGSLARYELDIIAVPPEVVVLMSDVYNAPELIHKHCCNCVIGQKYINPIQEKPITVISLQMIHNLQEVENIKRTLLEIVQDGIITSEEEPQMIEVINYLEKIKNTVDEAILWTKKNINIDIKKEAQQSALKQNC